MTLLTPSPRPTRARYERVGFGNHSDVYRRPGSRWCVQVFRPDCPELTPDKVREEYAYLVRAYAAMPGLIPWQRLFVPCEGAHICEALLVKEWAEVDFSRPLNQVRGGDLDPARLAQVEEFILRTRSQLLHARFEETLLVDILDPRWTNVAFDTAGRLRVLDTNRLVSTRALRSLAAGETLDIVRRRVHAKWMRRLMFLESRFLGRGPGALTADPVYTRYLAPGDFEALFSASAEAGEPIE
ncbi:hypothetical protein [Microbispora sp. NPDC049125]|uniref:hypothetical protein n=1 Tax=Microbispora sp. NPDC049125 TaxID=3154929 RepID=UPI003466CCAE